ncbi:MAG: DUF839 domain-containing protein [Tildeniella nuda ZEHNDER 1965/U140]|nr:DUF839 domain-containing protein [Tildeniella nuda ZEHNDER 1965/U140]
MAINRRHFLLFLGASAGTVACNGLPGQRSSVLTGQSSTTGAMSSKTLLGFNPLKSPIPLSNNDSVGVKQVSFTANSEQQIAADFASYEVIDDLVLPEGYTYDILAKWGDKVGDSRFGYNNDYLSLVETSAGKGFLTVNFEYISAVSWQQTYEKVIGKALPLREVDKAVRAAIKAIKDDKVPGLNAFALADSDPVKAKVKLIAQEALTDLGLGVLSVQRESDGRWVRTNVADRRVTGISGLTDGRYLKATGPAVAIFSKTKGQGYVDKLGAKIIGTMQNCAGGTTPWGTVLSAEENIQGQVPEPVHADGTSFDPIYRPFNITDEEISGLGNVFGLAGNKYGWMVEIDPANPDDYGTKHTWLGRYRHEAVGIRAEAGKRLVFYSGCDRRGGHLYKFVSKSKVSDPKDKANSKLLTEGMLYAAKFNADGTGRWIALSPSTPVAPEAPGRMAGGMLPLPQRPKGGVMQVEDDEQITAFQKKFKTLGQLYTGSDAEKQGAILIDAHYAGNAAGATCTARPEDTEIAPDGSLLIAFTSGAISKEDGSPDVRIFKGPDGSSAYEYGWVMRLSEDGNEPAAMSFKWEMMATGGEPAAGGLGFSNPDNLAFDPNGNLWIVTDMPSDKMNYPVPADRLEKNGVPVKATNLRGLFGNNSLWCIPLAGEAAGTPFLFGTAPMDAELTGPYFAPDAKTLFLSVQHPGELNGTRKEMAAETRQYSMRMPAGQSFMQTRKVPIGSNWPTKQPNEPPIPAVVTIRRRDQGAIAT